MLSPGTSLLHYRVVEKIGEGGMGAVWRATDATLDRDVAIKVLPAGFASDAERLARFEREAKVLASLNHPNIGAIYGFHEEKGVRFLAMELVPGEDLAERLNKGSVPIAEAVDIARQIAAGLEYAHERGIVHRDLKPANIKITPDGTVKVLDFGLAKAVVGELSGSAPTSTPTILPTMTSAGTAMGMILGTAAYMSPEQARGKPVDKRADIWAFGVVLFEMITGRRLFEGETASDSIAAVLRANVELSALPPATPAAVRALLARCLDRDPQSRLRDVGEARIVLSAPYAESTTVEAPSAGRSRRTMFAAAAVAVIAALIGLLAGRFLLAPASRAKGADAAFDIALGDRILLGSLAVSPDGANVVFSARANDNSPELWLRAIDSLEAHALPGTTEGRDPFWSPDGREIGFFSGDNVFRLALDGTAPRRIATVRGADGGTWGPGGTILVGSGGGPILKVSADGGSEPVAVSKLEDPEQSHVGPVFLPDGRRFVFMSDGSTTDAHRIHFGSLDGGPAPIVIKGLRSMPVIDPRGRILLVRDGQLVAFPFDADKGKITGEATLVADGIAALGNYHTVPARVSANGVLVYQSAPGGSALDRFDLDGKIVERVAPPALQGSPAVSPTGRALAFLVTESSEERRIWVQDLERGVRTAISERGKVSDDPTWSATDDVLYFDSNLTGAWKAYRANVGGGSAAEDIGAPEGRDLRVLDCSPDGKLLLVSSETAGGSWDLYLRALDVAKAPWSLWLKSPAADTRAKFSPDSRSIAYVSDASGRPEIYVAPVAGGATVRRTQISSTGGIDPQFSPDGRFIFYRTPGNDIVSVDVDLSVLPPRIGKQERRFNVPAPLGGSDRNSFAIARDGKSLIVAHPESSASYVVHVKTGWPAGR
jgi:Tol biopolymer transport system component